MPACDSTTAAPSARTCRRVDPQGRETDDIIRGLGTLYTWNVVSPRLGITTKLTADGRTMLRASYGRFSQGVLTGELGPFHPGVTPIDDHRLRSRDRRLHAHRSRWSIPRSTCGSIRTCGRRAPTSTRSASIARSAAGWRWRSPTCARTAPTSSAGPMSAGQYREETRTLPTAAASRCSCSINRHADRCRRFLLTNPDGYSLTYNGLVMVVEKRRSHGWQAFGSVHVVEGRPGFRPPAGRPPPARRSAPWRRRRAHRPHVRARSQRSHQRARPACRTIARTCFA